MINARIQIKELLEMLDLPVKPSFPEGTAELPLITYSEITNVNVEPNHDRIIYQIDVYANTFSECIDITENVDEIISGIGFTRNYVSPDTSIRMDQDLYHKAISYTADINTALNNIYQHKTRRD